MPSKKPSTPYKKIEHKNASFRLTFYGRQMEMKRFLILFMGMITVLFSITAAFGERGNVSVRIQKPFEAYLPLTGKKIGIDPGHQEKANSEREAIAPGSSEKKAKVASGTKGVSTGKYEYETNLQVSLLLKQLLTDLGAEVLMTRETHDVDISNQERAIMMNEWGADVVLRIHCNGSEDSSVEGMGMYVRYSGACKDESYLLGEMLLEYMANETGARKQRVYKRDTYTGLNFSTVPCVLVEMGYMTHPEEDRKLNDAEYQNKLVLGAAKGIIAYFEANQ